jgi:hypothetical protein
MNLNDYIKPPKVELRGRHKKKRKPERKRHVCQLCKRFTVNMRDHIARRHPGRTAAHSAPSMHETPHKQGMIQIK